VHLDHVGIAVDDAEAVRALYDRLLGLVPYKTEAVAEQGVRTHFLDAGPTKLELLEALGPDSPVARHLAKRGEGLHHLAFEVADVEAAIERLREAGFQPLSDTPRDGADAKRIVFLHPRDTHGVLVELCQQTHPRPEPEAIATEAGTLAGYACGRPDAPPVLVLHGAAGCTALETQPLIRRLEPRFRVLAVDFSGHGASAFPPDAGDGPLFSADLFAANARAALDHFGVAQAHVVGFSMGGYMALHFAKRHPARVDRLALHGGCIDWDDALVARMNARLDADKLAGRPALTARLDAAHTDWRRLFRALPPFIATLPGHSPAMAEAARAATHPTLVSAVDRDDLFPLDAPLGLHAALPNARLAILPGRRHALPQAPLDRLAATISAFLE
jgi:methylmalonyl-CoA epimerase